MGDGILVNMPYTQRRVCPICGKPNLLKLSEHLRQVHDLSTQARQPWLQQASVSPTQSQPLILSPKDVPIIIPPEDVPLQQFHSPQPCVDTRPHPDFVFQHPYSMMTSPPSLTSRLKSVPLRKQPTRKRKRQAPVINKSPLKKRKTNNGRVRKRPTSLIKKVQAAKKRKADPIKKRKSKSRKQPIHVSTSEEDIPEEEETEDSQEEEESGTEEPYSNGKEEENQYGGGWHSIRLRPPNTGRGFGPRIVYQ